MSNTGCFSFWSLFPRKRSRPSNDTEQSKQKPDVICEQPRPYSKEFQMGNILVWDHSPTFPRSKTHFDEVELVEINSSSKRFKGCDLPDIGNSTYLTSVLECLNHTDAFKDVLKSAVSCTEPQSENLKDLRLSELLHKMFSIMEQGIEKQNKQLINIIRTIKLKTYNNVHTLEQQDIILTLEKILELIYEEVEQISDILVIEVEISALCPTNPHDKAIHQSIFLMPLPLPLVNDTFKFDEYVNTCLLKQSQKIKCEKCSATLDIDHMHDVNVKLLSTPPVLILYTNCSTLKERQKWIENTYQPLQNQVKYEAYAYIEYKNTDTLSKKVAFLKWNDQWYKGSHPTNPELQWHRRNSLIVFLRKQNDTSAVSFPSNETTLDASVKERPKIDAESQRDLEMTAVNDEIEIMQNINHLPVKISEINIGSTEKVGANLCGLRNLGNTCYMNSALQCLVHTKPLRELVMNSLIQNSGIAKVFSNLVRDMWLPQQTVVDPKSLKSSVEMLDPQFIGNEQQDTQELISVLINGLHEEYNEVTGEKPYVDMKVDESKFSSEEEIEAAWKELRELRDKSEIINFFHVQIKITLRCHNCSYVKTSYDSLFPLSLPLPKTESNLTLESCLSLFTEEKQLANLKYCKSCHQDCWHFRKADIRKLPPILMVYLKRFNFHKSGNTKIDEHVAFSCNFPIQEVYPNAHDETDYQLYAVINHMGSLKSGHYISYIKCDEQWYSFNDSHYDRISEKKVCTANAYVLFYECTKKNLLSVCPEEAVINSTVAQKPPPHDLQETNSRSKNDSSKPAGNLAVLSSSSLIHETSRKRMNSPSTSTVKIMKPTRSVEIDIQVDKTDPIFVRARDSAAEIGGNSLSYQSPYQLRVHPTICGLVNFGNTCYMNSALQCLVHTKPLREFIIGSNTADKVLAKAFFNLINEMWMSGLDFCRPINIKKALGRIDSKFKENSQQDAQELISILINDLHEEFNEIIGEKPAVRMKVDESKFNSEEEVAVAWKKLTEKRDKSEIINIFNGQIKTTLKCHNCSNMQKSYDLFFPLILPLPSRKSGLNLEDCLKLFTEDKPLSNSKNCRNCHQVSKHSRKVDIWKLPPILMVYLKRFVMNKRGKYEKIKTHVDYSFMFPFEKFCHTNNQFEYQLYAVINHWGSLEFGHYFSFIKSDGNWFECNDRICKKITEDEIISSDAYVLFYQRMEKKLHCTDGDIKMMQSDIKLVPNVGQGVDIIDAAPNATATFEMSMVNESDSPQLLCHKAEIVPTLSLTLTTTDNKDGSEKTKEVLTKNDEPQDLSAITSVLQCLIHTKPLKSFIVKSRGSDKKLALFFYKLLNDKMSVPEIIMSQPEYLKLAIEQQDAQELISVLINGLHEEFNQVTGEKPYVDMKVDESKCSSEEEIAAAWKKLTELRDKSEIINIFHAQVKTTLRCGKCSYAQKSYDSLFPLSLPLPRKESRLTLTSCLRLFMREEQLSNSKKCKNCHDNCKHFRKADILKLPPILVVYLKRFHFLESGMTKIEKPVEFSCKFPIQEYYPNAHDDIEYKLYAVINHYGSLECGYYFSFIKCDEQWYSFHESDYNDYKKISEKEICTSNAYVLFYEYSEQRKLQIDHSKPEEALQLPKSSSIEMLPKSSDRRNTDLASNQSPLSAKTLTPAKSDLLVVEVDPTNGCRSSTTDYDNCLSTKQRVHRNICGLDSFGNTCSGMNSALQCLVHTKPLREFLIKCSFFDKVLAKTFVHLIKKMWVSKLEICQPNAIKTALEEASSKLLQNAQECINLFINGLCEEFNEEKTKQSEIFNIFFIKIAFKCDSCSKICNSWKHLFPLNLKLPAEKQSVTLEDCLREYAIENFSKNQIKCSTCQNDVLLSKVIELPLILVVCLDRFHNSGKKIRSSVKFSFTFPLEELCHHEIKTTKYQLYAVINHEGPISSERYYAYVKCEEEWYECKDKRCRKISEDDIFTCNAYVLFFERVNLKG